MTQKIHCATYLYKAKTADPAPPTHLCYWSLLFPSGMTVHVSLSVITRERLYEYTKGVPEYPFPDFSFLPRGKAVEDV
jgi:hypothetical protein